MNALQWPPALPLKLYAQWGAENDGERQRKVQIPGHNEASCHAFFNHDYLGTCHSTLHKLCTPSFNKITRNIVPRFPSRQFHVRISLRRGNNKHHTFLFVLCFAEHYNCSIRLTSRRWLIQISERISSLAIIKQYIFDEVSNAQNAPGNISPRGGAEMPE